MAARKPKKKSVFAKKLAGQSGGDVTKQSHASDKSTQRAPADTVRRSHDLLLLLRNAPQAAPDLRQCLAGRAVGAGDVR